MGKFKFLCTICIGTRGTSGSITKRCRWPPRADKRTWTQRISYGWRNEWNQSCPRSVREGQKDCRIRIAWMQVKTGLCINNHTEIFLNVLTLDWYCWFWPMDIKTEYCHIFSYSERANLLHAQNTGLVNQKRKLEAVLQNMNGEIEDLLQEKQVAEEKAKRAVNDVSIIFYSQCENVYTASYTFSIYFLGCNHGWRA